MKADENVAGKLDQILVPVDLVRTLARSVAASRHLGGGVAVWTDGLLQPSDAVDGRIPHQSEKLEDGRFGCDSDRMKGLREIETTNGALTCSSRRWQGLGPGR